MLIYLETRKSIFTQKSGEMPYLIKWSIKRVIKSCGHFEAKRKATEEVWRGKQVSFALRNFSANAKIIFDLF
jgi:hypothetical protein